MKFSYVFGIDISKETFNLSVHGLEVDLVFANTKQGVQQMLSKLRKQFKKNLKNSLFCMEHTGWYSYELTRQLAKKGLSFSLISGLEIKRSMGIQRGKNDIVDAQRIAEYAFMRQDKIVLSSLPDKHLAELQNLLSVRAIHVKTRRAYETRLNEQLRINKLSKSSFLYRSQMKLIQLTEKFIKESESEILKLIGSHEELKKQFELLISIKGIGLIIASNMLVKTKGFTAFDNWRKFACYCGTAPFSNQSGNFKGRSTTSKISDKKIKSLLTLASRTAVMYDPELNAYAKRRIKEGMDKRKLTNCIRNKLISRMFSVVKRGTPYVLLQRA